MDPLIICLIFKTSMTWFIKKFDNFRFCIRSHTLFLVIWNASQFYNTSNKIIAIFTIFKEVSKKLALIIRRSFWSSDCERTNKCHVLIKLLILLLLLLMYNFLLLFLMYNFVLLLLMYNFLLLLLLHNLKDLEGLTFQPMKIYPNVRYINFNSEPLCY